MAEGWAAAILPAAEAEQAGGRRPGSGGTEAGGLPAAPEKKKDKKDKDKHVATTPAVDALAAGQAARQLLGGWEEELGARLAGVEGCVRQRAAALLAAQEAAAAAGSAGGSAVGLGDAGAAAAAAASGDQAELLRQLAWQRFVLLRTASQLGL
jgi:hypothetical protein